MIKLTKIISISIIFFSYCFYANAFDLKSLTDKIQKDLGDKLQIPKGDSSSGSSNPLGGLLKNLNKNQGGSSLNMGNMNVNNQSSSSSGIKTAEAVCNPRVDKIIKNLPKGDIDSLSSDFNNKSNDQISTIIKSSLQAPDQFLRNLEVYDGAFETKEVEGLYSGFLSTKSLENLAALKALTEITPGFSKDKKQIKADASFAYGLIHYYYHKNGGNKSLGMNLIKEAAGTPGNIGALTLYGAWQFYGINVNQNIESGNANALEGYNRASEKNRETLVMGPFYQMKKIKYPEKVFLDIAADNRNPYKQQYQGQLANASQVKKDWEAKLAKNSKYDQNAGWYPAMIKQQKAQYKISISILENLGLTDELQPLKANFAILETEIEQNPNSVKTIEEMVAVNEDLVNLVKKEAASSDELDAKGKKQIAVMEKNLQLLILKNQDLGFLIMANVMMSGGGAFGNTNAMMRAANIMGTSQTTGCEAYVAVNSYADRTKIQTSDPLTAEDKDDALEDVDA